MSIIPRNILLTTDSYKPSHPPIYPVKMTRMVSYFESRGCDVGLDKTVFAGLLPIIRTYLEGQVVSEDKIREAEEFYALHLPGKVFNADAWRRMNAKHGGRLPVKIMAVPEGTVVGLRNVLMTVENTDPEFPWLTNFLETLLVQVWYPTTIASNSRAIKELLMLYHQDTSDAPVESVDFQCHDFGFRGVTCVDQAALGGMAHLISFKGTDTIAGVVCAREHYGEKMAGYSIPATEHSTMTPRGRDGEFDAFEALLDAYPDAPIVACVSDSYDIKNMVVNGIGGKFRERIMNGKQRVVVRPDSGDPVYTTLWLVQNLYLLFGGEINSKGYIVLHPNVRIIQGDGIDRAMIDKILATFKKYGFSSENIAFGSGGGLLQKFDRDTMKFAFKCCSVVVDGEERDVRKTPMEFNPEGEYIQSYKLSKQGNLGLIKLKDGGYATEIDVPDKDNVLRPVFVNGTVVVRDTFQQMRERAAV